MSLSLATAQHALLVFVLFTALAGAASAAVGERIRRGLAPVPPSVAASRLRGLLLLPVVTGAAMTIVTFLPSIAASIADVHHHCTAHGGHPHLCLVHAPTGAGSLSGWVILAAVAAGVGWRTVPLARAVARSARLASTLLGSRERTATVTIASREPLCAAVGLWSPTVVVSTGFADGVGPEALAAAMAHERAHARRRDGLWSLAARLAAVAHGPATAARHLAALDLATERACDEDAATALGDRLAVADAILRARRLGLRPADALAPAFGPAHWAVRVDALLRSAEPPVTGLGRRWDVRAGAATAAAIAAAGPLHHLTETALTLFAH